MTYNIDGLRQDLETVLGTMKLVKARSKEYRRLQVLKTKILAALKKEE